jgi:serine/threonine protein kinase
MPAPGTTVGHYRLGEVLGEGGMGVVQRAQDLKLGRALAIKFLSATDKPDARARFLREARAASALDHPNIGTVYEIAEAEGAPFIVMALYEGETLKSRLARGALPVEETVAIAVQLCRALAAAHQAGVVHRDLKPANVMLLPDGAVKLLDFGLAKLTSVDDTLTRDGTVLGTLAYMAPEQVKGGTADARTDLWALGAVLYELLAGAPPFGYGPANAVVAGILGGRPPPLEAPADLQALTARLLSRDPGRRLPSATAVEALLLRRQGPEQPHGYLVGAALVAAAMAVGALVTIPPRTDLSDQQLEATRGTYDRATRAFNLGRFEEAASAFMSAFEQTGERDLLFNVGQSYRLAGDKAHALEAYQRFLRGAPDTPLRAQVEANIRELSGSSDIGELERAYEKSGDAALLLQLGELNLALGNREKARHHFLAYQRTGGTDPAAARHLQELQPSPSP